MPKVLIVEDDESMGTALKDGFSYEGYEVAFATDGATALQMAKEQAPDLILLDVMLPKMSGFDVCKEIRAAGSAVPIIMLTARGQEIDKVLGLKLGADDYVTKPFGVLEVLARIEALLRRSRPARAGGAPERFGTVEVDPAIRQVRREGVPVGVSPKEFDLLWALLEANGAVLSRQELMHRVWGYEATVLSRTVDTHIAELRRKLERDPAEPRHLLTVRKAGYRLER